MKKICDEFFGGIRGHQKKEVVDYDLFSEKLTWLVRQIEGSGQTDALNILANNRAHFFQTFRTGLHENQSITTVIEFENVNDLMEKIICQIEKTRKN